MNTSSVIIQIKKLPGNNDIPLPSYQTDKSAGMDVHAAVKETIILLPSQIELISTGLSIALPEGYEAQIRPRSGLVNEFGISVPNSPGTIDSDFRGEINILLINYGKENFEVKRGMRIAQIIVVPIPKIKWDLVEKLPDTVRGGKGFGSTDNF